MNEENNKEVFQCVCGKQFTNKNQFNGHKGGCKIYKESIKDRKLKEQQEKESRRLPNGMFKCENPDCGKEHDGSYGSGRFCCKSCYKSFTSKHTKNSEKFQQHLNDMHNSNRAVYGTWKCKQCGLIFETRHLLQKHKREYHSNIHYCAWNKGLTKEISEIILNAAIKSSKKLKGKRHSQTIETREKISKARSKILDVAAAGFKDVGWYKVKNINNVEYTVRGHWEENVALKLNSLGILWEKNKWLTYFDGEINRQYNPDFYIPKQNLYIEVKGYFSDKDKLKMKLVLDQNDVKIYFIGSDKYQKFIDGQISFDDNLLYKVS